MFKILIDILACFGVYFCFKIIISKGFPKRIAYIIVIALVAVMVINDYHRPSCEKCGEDVSIEIDFENQDGLVTTYHQWICPSCAYYQGYKDGQENLETEI